MIELKDRFMSDELDVAEIEESTKRPKFLTVLCILSFVSTGFGLLFGLINMVMGPSSEEELLNAKVDMTNSISEMESVGMDSIVELMNKLQKMSEEINDHFYLASFLTVLTIGLGLYGVLKMWKGFKIGFHIYIVYCLLSIGAMYVYVSPENIPTHNVPKRSS